MDRPMFKAPDHPFYRPLWRRIAIVVVAAVWTGLEVLRGGEPTWMIISGFIFLYAAWAFLIGWKEPPAA